MPKHVFAFIAALSACASPLPVALVSAPLGEPAGGAPSWAERVALVYVNRARADPATELESCVECADRDCYAPAPPVVWDRLLGRAARFHATMLDHWGRGLSHASPCRLREDVATTFEPAGTCDGSPSCACEGGAVLCADPIACLTCTDCTPFDQRVRLFGASPRAENIAMAGSPLRAMSAFLNEPYDVATCGYGRDSRGRPNGHRFNILSPDRGSIGVGAAGSYLAQDFGYAEAPRGIVAGVHVPETGPEVELRANWYDDAPPAALYANVDGACAPMAVERGTDTNGTWLASASVGSGCVHYVFDVERTDGTSETLPSTGSYGIGCADEWSAERPPRCGCVPACDARSCGDDGCGGTCGACGSDETCVSGSCAALRDAGAAPQSDAGLVDASSASRDAATHLPSDGASPWLDDASPPSRSPRQLHGGCSCTAGRGGAGRWGVCLALLGLAIAATRRRGRFALVLAASMLVLASACASSGVTRRNGEVAHDAGSSMPVDASARGHADAGPMVRADAATSVHDAALLPFGDAGAGHDAAASTDAAVAIDAATIDADAPGSACAWRTVLTMSGDLFTVRDGAAQIRIPFVHEGEGFYCARVRVTMRTADTLRDTTDAYDGCPIFSHVVGLEGTGAGGRNVGGGFFRFLRLDCGARSPGALELDAWGAPFGRSGIDVSSGWAPGGAYRVTLEVVPFVSTISIADLDGHPIGPTVEVDISGTTVDMVRNPEIVMGLPAPVDGAYFPYFGATYSDLVVEADVAPALGAAEM